MNTSNNNLKEFLIDKLKEIKEYIVKHSRALLPIAVAIVAVIVIVISLAAHSKKVKREEAEAQEAANNQANQELELAETELTVPIVALEEDAYPLVNEFITKYYDAMAEGDIEAIKEMNNFVDETETIRIEETAKYIDKYTSVNPHVKVGPVENSYVVYVSSKLKFEDYDTEMPGMAAYYVCTDENGSLYINDGEETEYVINYIREVSLQDDVVDLNNEVVVAYNNMLAEDEKLSVFLLDLTETIDTSVGELLAQAEKTEEEETEAEETEETETGITSEVVTTVKTTTTVNVRSSDSETADKLGKASAGQEFKLIEERGNGWSEIDFNGKNAFIKTEFLEASGTETVINVPEEETLTTETTTTSNSGSTTVTGTVTVKENVRIRSAASETADKVATAYVGQKLDLIEKQSNGWSKIKYNGQVAYVKSQYVE